MEATGSGATADDARQVRGLTADKAAREGALAPLLQHLYEYIAIIHLALAWIDSPARCGPTEKFDMMNLVYPCHENQAKNKILSQMVGPRRGESEGSSISQTALTSVGADIRYLEFFARHQASAGTRLVE
jgi:hypothetical protein